ncbi:THUMP domain-containing protein [Mycena chlorophos]|uniref:THUMP domain-containing protein n=1 Tax=Mycena chlorophos TaxID=658473 RepID=A0A8H6WLD4_MYCCL|nr:THUMP domain-containing protein [Mycena chlorophos]
MSSKRPRAQGDHDARKRKKYRSDGTPIWGRRVIEGPGVWVSCIKGKERQAASEVCELFKNLAEEMWPETKATGTTDSDNSADEGEELSLEQQIAQEVSAMKRPPKQDLFKNCPTDTACLLFISCQPPVDPVKLVEQHLKNVDETGVTHTKYCMRLAPVSGSSVANLVEIEALCRSTFAAAFAEKPFKVLQSPPSAKLPLTQCQYKIELKLRNHTVLARDTLIATIAQCVPQDAGHSVDLGNPDLVILVEVFKSICGVSVVREYQKYKKFNVAEIASARQIANESSSSTKRID